jgi:hypothetical protein
MSKAYYFITITIGLTLLMKFAGIPYAGSDALLSWVGLNPDNLAVSTSYFVLAVIGCFSIGMVLGSIFSKESSIRASIATGILTTGIGAFIGILSYVKDVAVGSQEWIFYIVFMIFGVYITGFIFAMLEFWGIGQ